MWLDRKTEPSLVGKHADVIIIDESQTEEDCDYCKMTHKHWYEHCDTCDRKTEPQTCSVNGRPYSECHTCGNFRCMADVPQTERGSE